MADACAVFLDKACMCVVTRRRKREQMALRVVARCSRAACHTVQLAEIARENELDAAKGKSFVVPDVSYSAIQPIQE